MGGTRELNALDRAVAELRRRLVLVGGRWTAPTPCDEWDVHALVAHVVGGNHFALRVLAGQPAAAALDVVMATRWLVGDPVSAFDESVALQRQAFRSPGALASAVDHPVGVVSGARFLGLRTYDIAVHAWDLAVAVGDQRGLDPSLVDVVVEVVRREPIGDPGSVGAGATALEEVLVRAGRLPAT